jgi:hypothetical protein
MNEKANFEARNPKSETSTNFQNPNDQNKPKWFGVLKIWI